MSVRGIEVHYYAVCQRKLWLFHRGISFEKEHDRVVEGKVLHDDSYTRLQKEVNIDDLAVIDALEDEWVREIKISSQMENADRLQMLYYLTLLKERNVMKKGLLSYPREKKTVEVVLDEQGEKEVRKALAGIERVLNNPIPPFRKLPYCSKCAYRDFCYAGEMGEDEHES